MAADYDADVAARRAVVIEADAKLCGYMVAWPEKEMRTSIENISIEPGYQGSGLGRRFESSSRPKARRAGLAALSLTPTKP